MLSLNLRETFNFRARLKGTGPTIYPVTCNFIADDTEGDYPFLVHFTDISSEITTTAWLWDFGDGSTGPERFVQNPTHTYSAQGYYTVSLKISGPEGEDTKERIDYIHVEYAHTHANFHAHPVAGESPLDIQFCNESTGDVTDYLWDFGDGYTGAEQIEENPLHTYDDDGDYDVSLKAYNEDKEDTLLRENYITAATDIPAPVADFDADVTSGDYDLVVTFDNLTTGIVNTWEWNFGDGSTGADRYEFEPVHTYEIAGTFDVSLKAIGPDYDDTETKVGYITVTVPAPVPDFTADVVVGDFDLDVTFDNTTTGVVDTWLWNFGDGSTGDERFDENPVHTYTARGTYTVSLKATGPDHDATKTRTSYIQVKTPAPVADFTADITSGDYDLEVPFTNSSTGTVDSWLWDFGDGHTSTEFEPTYIYKDAGVYHVTLLATGPDYEDEKRRKNYITVTVPAPVPEFTGSATSGDYDLAVTFDNTTTGIVDTWDWDFGDGSSHSSSFEPTHTYIHSGTYTVVLKATGPDHEATRTRTNYITVTIPYADANFSFNYTSGNYPLAVVSTDSSTYYRAEAAITAWEMDWGDGTTKATGAGPWNHTYAIPGTFTAVLKVTNARGNNTETKTSYCVASVPSIPSNPELEVYLETTACRTVVTGSPDRLSHIKDLDATHDFTQGTSANRPEYDTTTPTPLSPNGKQGAHFNGDYVLENNGQSNTYIDQNAGQLIAMVVGNLTQDDDTLFAKWNSSTDDRRFELMTNLYNVSKRSNAYVENASAIFTRPTGAFHIIIARWSPGVYTKVWIDNVLAGTAVTPTTATLPDTVNCEDRIGSRGDGYSLTTGDVWAIVNYRATKTDQEASDLYWNLYNRYKL